MRAVGDPLRGFRKYATDSGLLYTFSYPRKDFREASALPHLLKEFSTEAKKGSEKSEVILVS